METLAYSHLATAEETSIVEPNFEAVNWKKFSSLGMMGLLSVATVLGALSATADSATACHHTCSYGSRYGSHAKKHHRFRYRHASYRPHHGKHGYYLHLGSRGHKVAKLQHKLGLMGYFHHHRATGYFGYKTKHAVKAFQRNVGLKADGIVGPRTKMALGY